MSVHDLSRPAAPPPKLAVNEQDAAAMLGVSARTLFNWRKTRTGPWYRRMGSRLLYAVAELERWLADSSGDAATAALAESASDGGAM